MSSPESAESSRGSDPAVDTVLEEHVFNYELDEDNENRTQVEETQFVDVEIDTQATTGYDRRGVVVSPQPASPALPMMAKPKQFTFSLDDDDDVPAFAFEKATIKSPAISIAIKGADQARVPTKEVTQAPIVDNNHAPKISPQKHAEKDIVKPLQPSPPKPGKRAPLSSNDPNRQMSMGINQHGGDGDATKLAQAMPMAAMMSTAAGHEHQASMPTTAIQHSQAMSLEPPLTQAAPPMAPRKARRKKTAPAAMQHVFPQQLSPNLRQNVELEPESAVADNVSRQQAELPHNTSIEAGNIQAPPTNMMDPNTSFMAQLDNHEDHPGTMHQIVDQRAAPVNARSNAPTAMVPTARIADLQHASRSPPKSGIFVENVEAQIPRPAQTRAKQASIAILPFPEAGISSARRNSPMPVNRPLPSPGLQTIPANVTRPVAGNAPGKVTKRKRSAASKNFNGRAEGSTGMPDARPQLRRVEAIREDKPITDYAAGLNESVVNGGQRNELVRPSPVARHMVSSAKPSLDLSAGLDLFDQAKNAFTTQVLEKDRELAHLKSEMDRLVQTVQNLEEDVSRLEGDKTKLRGDMYQKCESLKVKVGELLKDHKAVGGFIEKTNTDIEKFNKYREKSGSIFKEAITKYADIQQHQKKTMEAIHDARMHVAHDIADLTKAHNHESGIVLKDLQAEKKKVSELEKALDSEKQKVMHLETRLDADLQGSIKAMLEKQNETFAAKVENGGKELLEAISTKQEEKTASLKNYLKTLQAYKEHETDASQAIGELLSQITELSANVAEALKSKDTAQDGLHKVGTEILNTIKEKVESISESHDNQTELANRVLLLETSKINLESQVTSETQAKVDLQTQLEAKNAELEQNLAQLLLKEQELKTLQSRLQQGTTRSQQEVDALRSSLATVNEELQELKEIQTQLQEDNQTLHAQNSRLTDEGESASEHLRRSQESIQQSAQRLKASEEENARVLRRAEAAEAKTAEMQAKFTELAASSKQQLETQRIRMEEDKRRAQQGTKSELSTLKKRYEKLEAENSSLKDAIAAQPDAGHLKQEISRLEREKSHIKNSHASDLHKFGKVLEFQAQKIEVIREQAAQLAQAGDAQEKLRQMGRFKEQFETAVGSMESRLAYHEGIELNIRAYCEKQGWNYDEMDVETFFYQISATAVEEYRQSLNSSSFSTQIPRPSMSFGQSMSAAATAGSPLQHSQSSATRHRGESVAETIQVPGTQTPRMGRRSPSMPKMPSRSPLARMVSPPRARRNQSIAERRRSLASEPKPTSPDTAGTPVRKPSDRTTGTGGRGARAIPTPMASNVFDIPDSSQEPSQRHSVGHSKASSGSVPKPTNTPARPSGDANGRVDSDLSDLTDIMDLMDQQPEVDPIPALEQQRRQRASCIVEDSQSQRGKAPAMEPPSTPRHPAGSQSQEVKPLKSILKKPLKRDHSISQQAEETPSQAAPPRRQLQPLKGKNSLASLGTGVAGFRSSQDTGPSRTVGFRAREVSLIESTTIAAEVETTAPAINTGQRLKRTKTIRSGALGSQTQAAPTARTTRMSIPYKPSSSRK